MAVDLLSIGKTSLAASKKSLSTTSHNIANANTEGYSRQRVNLQTNNPIGEGSHVFGTGVDVKSVKRIHDELIEKRVNKSITGYEYNKERSLQLSQVEEIFNEVNSGGLNKILNRFFNSFRELANQPENETVRSVVREDARLVVTDFKRMREKLTSITDGIEKKIGATVGDINSLTHSLASLNNNIAELEAVGTETGDLRDQRDSIVRQLAEFFPIQTYTDDKGMYIVNIEDVGSLVAGATVQELKVGTVTSNAEDKGKLEVFFASKPGQNISGKFKNGSFGALIKTRNDEITNLVDQVDKLAFELVHTVNAIHRKGFINQPFPEDQNGEAILPAGKKVTGINFFKEPLNLDRAAEYIDLSDEVTADVNNIVTGLQPNTPGDNRISIAISKLQHEKILDNGTTTFEEHYLESVGGIGLITAKSRIDEEQSQGILAQARALKERVSGVSIDEETANMVRFQHAYEASAKVLKTADEMFKAVLGIMPG